MKACNLPLRLFVPHTQTRNVDPSRPLGPLPPWAATLAERIAQLPEVGCRVRGRGVWVVGRRRGRGL